MNRQEAAREIDNTACCFSDKRFRDAMHMAATALRGPQPDPITGLVPCGCGGKAETHELFGQYSGTYMTDCKECATGTTQYNTKEESQDAWNTAMGYTPPGAIGPEQDGTAPNGDKGAES